MIEFINYFVCFIFGVMTGGIAITAMVVVLVREKPHHGP